MGETFDLNSSFANGEGAYKITYSSSNPSIATAAAAGGLVTAKKTGTAVVTATTYNGKEASCTVTVKKAPTKVELSKTSLTLGVGETFDFNKLLLNDGGAYNVTYKSSNPEVVSANGGMITAEKQGKAVITASVYNGEKASCTVTVKEAPTKVNLNKTSLTLGVGETFDLNSSFENGEGAYKITYSSSDPSIATAAASGGLVTAINAGTATITATAYNGKEASCTVTVMKAPTKVSLNKTSLTLGVGETFYLNSSFTNGEGAYQITYSSSDSSIAIVAAADGLVTAKKVGTAVVTVTTYNGEKASCAVTVKKAPTKVKLNTTSLTLGVGETYDLNSSLANGEGAHKITYSSSNPSTAVVAAAGGLVTAKNVGTTTVTATTYNGKKVTCSITVKKAPTNIYLNKTRLVLNVGEKYDLNCSFPSGEAAHYVAYTSAGSAIASVEKAGGMVTAKNIGTTTVTATTYNGKKATCSITVKIFKEKCIDVSTWNGNIDWNEVVKSGIKYAMIRSSFGIEYPNQVDNKFVRNITNATKAGVKCGVYHYSYAKSVEDATKEAEFCLKTIKGYNITLPVAFDIEDDSQTSLGKDTLTNIVIAFCDTIKAAGYTPMLYTNSTWLNNYLYKDKLMGRYDIWLAQWQVSSPSYDCAMWQYSNSGTVPGILGEVDLDYIYKDYTGQGEVSSMANTVKVINNTSYIRSQPYVDGYGVKDVKLSKLNAGATVTWLSGDGISKVKYGKCNRSYPKQPH